MAVLQVKNPFSGSIEKVNFSGNEPTQEEIDSLTNFFRNETTKAELDLLTASPDEIRDYARKRRSMGLDPVTGETLSEDELIKTYKEPGVDYSTGLDSIGGFSRFQFGRMDTKEEKENYLESVVGKDGFRSDALGRLLLTQKGRKTLGMGEGPDLAIDEEGLSFSDVKDFVGQSGLPIISAIGAGIAASGVGFFPGMLIVGGAAALGKAVDEGLEYAEGLQMQTGLEVARDSAIEGGFAMLGEGIGRGLSRLFGRIIKGPGGPENEVLRTQARELISRGFRPTVGGATDEEFRPLLNRLQSVYEGVFPNANAARVNLQNIIKEMRSLGITDNATLKNLDEVVKKDIDNYYQNANDALSNAQKKMDTETMVEIDKLMSGLRDVTKVPKDLNDLIESKNLGELVRIRKKIFDQDIDRVYSKITDELKESSIIPTSALKEQLKEISKGVSEIEKSKLASQIRSLGPFATPIQMARLRTGLIEAGKQSDLVGGANVGALSPLKKAIDQAFLDAEISIKQMMNLNKVVPKGVEVKTPIPEGFKLNVTMDEAGDSLALLRRANNFYRLGVKRFDNATVQSVIKQAQKGQLNTKFILSKIIEEDNLDSFDQLMKSLRGIPQGRLIDLEEGKTIVKARTIGNRTFGQALEDVSSLPKNDPTRRTVEKTVQESIRQAQNQATTQGAGKELSDAVRRKIAADYLEYHARKSTVLSNTGQRVIDPLAFVNGVRSKGIVLKRLFGTDYKNLDDLLKVLEKSKANLAPNVLLDIKTKPLGSALLELKEAEIKRSALDSETLMKTLNSTNDPDIIAGAVFKNSASVKQATNYFKDSPETLEKIKDAAMGKLLKQIGATTDDNGVITLSDDFINSFKSGRLGDKLQGVIRSYGDDTLNAMFGKEATEGLKKLAVDMVKVSNASIAGKGGLAAPQIALGFTFGNLLFSGNFLSLLGTGLAFKFMSNALRNPKVLKMMMASREPNTVKQFLAGKLKSNHPFAQGFQVFQQLLAQSAVQTTRGLVEQTTEEARPYVEETIRQVTPKVQEMTSGITSQLPNVMPPAPGTSASMINPITIPDPATLALAQQLQNRKGQP